MQQTEGQLAAGSRACCSDWELKSARHLLLPSSELLAHLGASSFPAFTIDRSWLPGLLAVLVDKQPGHVDLRKSLFAAMVVEHAGALQKLVAPSIDSAVNAARAAIATIVGLISTLPYYLPLLIHSQ